ncbi:MAG: 50S ribosomal protein L10 [archaeon]|nr:50S ribosomal protein L10 [archaeon]
MKKHLRTWKTSQLTEIKQLADSYPVIAIADISNFPAALFAVIRKKLSAKSIVKVSKTKVVKKAFAESKMKDVNLNGYIKGSLAIIFTQMSPFELFAFVKKGKGSIPAKPGMIAPMDLIVPAGDTGLPPGPALSELKQAGINARIQGSSIFIPEDTVVVKKGAIVSKPAASTLQKLGIKPIKVGLNIVSVIENKEIFKAEYLDIDAEKVFGEFSTAHIEAFNLAVFIAYANKDTIPVLLRNGHTDALNLAINAAVLNDETVKQLLSKANLQALALKEKVKE